MYTHTHIYTCIFPVPAYMHTLHSESLFCPLNPSVSLFSLCLLLFFGWYTYIALGIYTSATAAYYNTPQQTHLITRLSVTISVFLSTLFRRKQITEYIWIYLYLSIQTATDCNKHTSFPDLSAAISVFLSSRSELARSNCESLTRTCALSSCSAVVIQ